MPGLLDVNMSQVSFMGYKVSAFTTQTNEFIQLMRSLKSLTTDAMVADTLNQIYEGEVFSSLVETID